MKKSTFFIIILIAIVVGCGIWYYKDSKQGANLGEQWYGRLENMMASSSDLKSLPFVAVFSSATTTDAGGSLPDGGATIDQELITDGFHTVILNIQAVGGTATSTFNVRQMGSFDGTTFYNIATSTTERTTATTTKGDLVTALSFDPGTVTTTMAVAFDVTGYKYTRFILWGDNLSTDPNDGVQAYVDAIKVADFVR
jgi:hypothetical protein